MVATALGVGAAVVPVVEVHAAAAATKTMHRVTTCRMPPRWTRRDVVATGVNGEFS